MFILIRSNGIVKSFNEKYINHVISIYENTDMKCNDPHLPTEGVLNIIHLNKQYTQKFLASNQC
jgi:hypothetical protein